MSSQILQQFLKRGHNLRLQGAAFLQSRPTADRMALDGGGGLRGLNAAGNPSETAGSQSDISHDGRCLTMSQRGD